MNERVAHRRLIISKSAGRGRVVSIYYSPLNLRYEMDYSGNLEHFVIGTSDRARREILIYANAFIAEIKSTDKSRLTRRLP